MHAEISIFECELLKIFKNESLAKWSAGEI
jgi:hypothetical protein